MSEPPTSPRPPASKGPLSHEAFRAVWIASIFSNVGTWVQDVGESWLMMSLTKDPLPVAMLTTAMTLSMFVLLMPAGVAADRADRRRLLIASQTLMAIVAFALAVATSLGWASPALLLAASAGLGVGQAMSLPAWNSLIPELVPRRHTAEAVTLNSVAFNAARTIGPALGGMLLAAQGPAAAFFVNALSFVGVIEVLRRYDDVKRAAHGVKRKPEALVHALTAAFVHFRRSKKIRAVHIAVATFGFAAASVPALLPVFAKEALHTTSTGYGWMLGAIGCGAVLAAGLLRRLRDTVPTRAIVAGSMATYGLSMLALTRTHSLAFALPLLIPAGMAWLGTFSTLNSLVQLSVPMYLKSRALALYQLAFYAAWSLGAFIGGVVANRYGAELVFTLAAASTLVPALLTARLPLPSYDHEMPPSSHDVIHTPMPISAR